MKMKGITCFYIAIMIIMLAIIGHSVMMEYFASKLLPLVFGSIGFILAAIGFRQEVLTDDRLEKTDAVDKAPLRGATSEGRGNYLTNGAWLLGFAAGIFMLGFATAIPLFLLFYMRWMGTRWRTSLINAVVTTAIVYGVFEIGLQIELYGGLLLPWLGH